MNRNLVWLMVLLAGAALLSRTQATQEPARTAPSNPPSSKARTVPQPQTTPSPAPAVAGRTWIPLRHDNLPCPDRPSRKPGTQGSSRDDRMFGIRVQGRVETFDGQQSLPVISTRRLEPGVLLRTGSDSVARLSGQSNWRVVLLSNSVASRGEEALMLREGDFKIRSFAPEQVQTPIGLVRLEGDTRAEISIRQSTFDVICSGGRLELPDGRMIREGDRIRVEF